MRCSIISHITCHTLPGRILQSKICTRCSYPGSEANFDRPGQKREPFRKWKKGSPGVWSLFLFWITNDNKNRQYYISWLLPLIIRLVVASLAALRILVLLALTWALIYMSQNCNVKPGLGQSKLAIEYDDSERESFHFQWLCPSILGQNCYTVWTHACR